MPTSCLLSSPLSHHTQERMMPNPELTLYTTPFSRGTYAVWMLKE